MAKDQQIQQDAETEGPRNFGMFLDKLASGDAQVELSRELHKLVKALKEEARIRETKIKGSLDLKMTFEVDGKDDVPIVLVNYEVATKLPKPARRKGHFWMTEGGNLTSEAPKQEKLPLQDVGGGRRPTRDAGDVDRRTKEA